MKRSARIEDNAASIAALPCFLSPAPNAASVNSMARNHSSWITPAATSLPTMRCQRSLPAITRSCFDESSRAVTASSPSASAFSTTLKASSIPYSSIVSSTSPGRPSRDVCEYAPELIRPTSPFTSRVIPEALSIAAARTH